MIDERQQELASLYAFDLIEGAERAQFEASLARDPELRTLVDDLRRASSQLAHLAPAAEPPAALRSRILATIEAKPSAAEAAKVVAFPKPFAVTSLLPWAIAAGFALCTAWLGGRYATTRAEARLLQQQQELADVAIRSARAQIEAEHILARRALAEYDTLKTDSTRQLADAQHNVSETQQKLAETQAVAAEADRKRAEAEQRVDSAQKQILALNDELKQQADLARLKIATLASMLNNSPQALAVAVWDPKRQEGVFTVDKLPANTADQRYELWVIDKAPVSAGVFTVGPDGRAKVEFKPVAKVQTAAKFAVSLEANDGARSHATPGKVIMLSE